MCDVPNNAKQKSRDMKIFKKATTCRDNGSLKNNLKIYVNSCLVVLLHFDEDFIMLLHITKKMTVLMTFKQNIANLIICIFDAIFYCIDRKHKY